MSPPPDLVNLCTLKNYSEHIDWPTKKTTQFSCFVDWRYVWNWNGSRCWLLLLIFSAAGLDVIVTSSTHKNKKKKVWLWNILFEFLGFLDWLNARFCLLVFVWFSRGVSYLEGIIISRKSMTHSQLDTHLRCAGNYTNKEQLVSESLIWWERHFIFINLLDSLQSYTKGVKMISCLSKFLGDFFCRRHFLCMQTKVRVKYVDG